MEKTVATKDNQSNQIDQRVTLYELVHILRKSYLSLALLTFLGMSSSVIYSLLLPNIYTSTAILTLTNTENVSSGPASQTNAILNLAGLDLSGGTSKDIEIIARMNSYNFFLSSILPLLQMEDLIAVKDWDSKNNRIIYDNSIYDEKLKTWLIPEPSAQEGHKAFMKIFKASIDDLSGFIMLSIEHESPFIAQMWLDGAIKSINALYKEETQKRSTASLLFLNEKMARTNYSEIKSSLAFLIQKQTQTLMMAEENENYIVTPIEVPFVSEQKSGPNRFLNVIFGTLLGFILGVFIALTSAFYRSEKALSKS